MKTALIVLALASVALGKWTGLRAKWSPNPLDPLAFASLPRNLNSDDMDGFTMKDGNSCNGHGRPFLGRRYWKNSDPGVAILFDKNGFIAGIQTLIPKSVFSPSSHNRDHPYIDDGNFWTLTAYFVNPSIICTTGRSQADYDRDGTGTGLWLQMGNNPVTDFRHVPNNEADILSTPWTKGKCFLTMGVHYWYDVTSGMNCDNFYPFFVLYNDHKLNAFGFAVNAVLSSKRYEHPPLNVIFLFLKPVPQCFHTDPSFAHVSTLHVYMTNHPVLQDHC